MTSVVSVADSVKASAQMAGGRTAHNPSIAQPTTRPRRAWVQQLKAELATNIRPGQFHRLLLQFVHAPGVTSKGEAQQYLPLCHAAHVGSRDHVRESAGCLVPNAIACACSFRIPQCGVQLCHLIMLLGSLAMHKRCTGECD